MKPVMDLKKGRAKTLFYVRGGEAGAVHIIISQSHIRKDMALFMFLPAILVIISRVAISPDFTFNRIFL